MAAAPRRSNVLITGGTGSVGEALVKAFAVAGHHVEFQYNSNDRIAASLHRRFKAKPIRLDFKRELTLPETRFDVLVNNAAVNTSDAETGEISVDDWDLTLRTNLDAPFAMIRQCLPWMIRRRWGRIINISSIYGLRGIEGRAAYVASKHGLSGLTKTVAREYGRRGITCNEVCPGPIQSKMMSRIARRSARVDGGTPAAYLRSVAEEIPMGRILRPSELADLVLFLASQGAGYINGASIPIDGGMTA